MNIVDYVFVNSIIRHEPETVTKQVVDIIKAVSDKRGGVEVKDRSYHFKKYPQCFIAKDFVTWISNRLSIDRIIALRVGIFLQQKNYIEHVVRDHVLKDEHLFFRFKNLPFPHPSPGAVSSIYIKPVPTCQYDIDFLAIKVPHVLPLPKRSYGGRKSDITTTGVTNPYCKIVMGDELYTTSTIENTTQPNWVSKFKIKANNLPTTCYIILLDMDKAQTMDNDVLGYASFVVRRSSEREYEALTLNLFSKDTRTATGVLKVLFTVKESQPEL
ncbi:vacuolar membrane-associated protein IML1 [Acrasis kona]|uniref:Vacuolar membrane-associated protein IML1 n=1 Tax=Acrasis kona TaxID=1008807 RepID=A0AAW2ZGX1_9EUKA